MQTIIPGVYLGKRDNTFKSCINRLLKLAGGIKQKYTDLLLSEESLRVFSDVFTSEGIDTENNYQVYEQLGDLTCNKFIVWYIYDRFPQLRCPEGVKVAARIRINYGSKNSFSALAESLGFWDFISATNDTRSKKRKPLLEDVFEAFIGAVESILDNSTMIGVGYAVVFKILKKIFDGIPISLDYEDLYDAKTRLKELFDLYGENLGALRYEENREKERKENNMVTSVVYRVNGSERVFLGSGSASLKADAEQIASKEALKSLEKSGYVKHPPSVYARFKKGGTSPVQVQKTSLGDVMKVIKKRENINDLLPVKGKSKYQNKYVSTALGNYCRKGDVEGANICLEIGGDPNIEDSDSMTALDLLCMSRKSVELLFEILEFFPKKAKIHSNVCESMDESVKGYIREKFRII